METQVMKNRYGRILFALSSVLLVDSVSCVYRSYSYNRYSYYYDYYDDLYYYAVSNNRYSSGSKGVDIDDLALAGIIIGVLFAIGISIVIPICCYCCRKRQISPGVVLQTGTVISTNANVASPPGQEVNGSSTYPLTTYTTTTDNATSAPGMAMTPAIKGDNSKPNGKGGQCHHPPYSTGYVNVQRNK